MDAMYFSTLPVPITAYNPLVDSTTRDCSQNYTAGIISVVIILSICIDNSVTANN